jgi:threonine dehydratase
MTSPSPTFADVQAAADRLSGVAVETPLLTNETLDQTAGGRVLVKAECLQRTGSFKIRGAFNRLSQLSEAQREAGVVAFSSGNHAQGVAAAARDLGVRALIVMPSDAPRAKLEATRALGAEIVLYDRFTQSREAIARDIARERGAVVVPSYDDPDIIAGQGTAGLEAARQVQDRGVQADLLLAPASGGGLIAGIGLAFEALSPGARLYAVEPAGFEDHRLSLEAGTPTPNAQDRSSLCDALLAAQPGDLTFAINRRRLSGALAVTDAEALAAMAFAFRHLKLVLEPGGAVALAAVLSHKPELNGRTAVVIASGGNVDADVFCRALSSG